MARALLALLVGLFIVACGAGPHPPVRRAEQTPTPTSVPRVAPSLIAADWDGDEHLLLLVSGSDHASIVRHDLASGSAEALIDLPPVPRPAVLRASPPHALIVPLFASSAILADWRSHHVSPVPLAGATSVEWFGSGPDALLASTEYGDVSDSGSLSLFRLVSVGTWSQIWHQRAPRWLSPFSGVCQSPQRAAIIVLDDDPAPSDPQQLTYSVAWWQLVGGHRLSERDRHNLPPPPFVYKGITGDCTRAISVALDKNGNGTVLALDRADGVARRLTVLSNIDMPADLDLRLSPNGHRLLVLQLTTSSSSYQIADLP